MTPPSLLSSNHSHVQSEFFTTGTKAKEATVHDTEFSEL